MSDLPPDRTTRLSRTQRNVLVEKRAGAPRRFSWPAPPYWEFAEPGERPAAEECLLSFLDGEKATGTLVDFVPDVEALKFRPSTAHNNLTVAFSDLQGVHLLNVAPTLLELGGYDVPESMQGTSLLGSAAARPSPPPASGEDVVRERLKGLGYLG